MEIILKGPLPQIMEAMKAFISSDTGAGEDSTSTSNEEGNDKETTRPTGRKRRTKPEAEEPEAESEAPKRSGRKGRGKAKAEEDEEDETPKKSGRRGRKGRGKKSEPDDNDDGGGEEDSGISDVDLSKASSEAAEDIGPKQVRKVLDTFGCATVAELEDDLRQEFLEALADKVAEANDD